MQTPSAVTTFHLKKNYTRKHIEMLPPQPNPLPDYFYQKVHYSEELPTSAPVDLYAFGNYRNLTPEIVNAVVEKEYQKFMKKFHAEEDDYVDQKLREKPVIWYNRTSTPLASPTKASTSRTANQEQTSNCTKCKINNKIKKAKSKHRYNFMTEKLEQHAVTLQSLRNFIGSAEGKLRSKGRSEDALKELRDIMGIDRVRVDNLPDINRKFFKAAENAPEE